MGERQTEHLQFQQQQQWQGLDRRQSPGGPRSDERRRSPGLMDESDALPDEGNPGPSTAQQQEERTRQQARQQARDEGDTR